MKEDLIAPCGMNCRICVGFFGYTMTGKKRKMICPGCRPSRKSCAHVKKFCEKLSKDLIEFCFECEEFPCKHIQRLDTKYQERFDMSSIENLRMIKNEGMEAFLAQQNKHYTCPECGHFWCVHTKLCYNCGQEIK